MHTTKTENMSKFSLFIVSVFLVSTLASNIPSSSAKNINRHHRHHAVRSENYLAAHNAARSQLGIGALHWDETLASYARNYTAKIQSANACDRLEHSGGPYGENLAAGTGKFYGQQAVNLWVGEREDYDYESNSCAAGKVCGHYTQVVGRRSNRLGCAKVSCANGWWYVICNYAPAGNIVGQRPY